MGIPERHRHWRVVVETSGEHIVSIEPEMLAGREISEVDEELIRTAAHHLLAFIGDPYPAIDAELLGVVKRALRSIEMEFPNGQLVIDMRSVIGKAEGGVS